MERSSRCPNELLSVRVCKPAPHAAFARGVPTTLLTEAPNLKRRSRLGDLAILRARRPSIMMIQSMPSGTQAGFLVLRQQPA